MTADEQFESLIQLLTALNAKVDALAAMSAKVDALEAKTDNLASKLEALTVTVDARFAQVDARFAQVDARFDRVDDYILDFRQEVAQRFERFDRRMEIFSNGLVSVDTRIPGITKALVDLGAVAEQVTVEQSQSKRSAADLAIRVARLEEQMSKLIALAA